MEQNNNVIVGNWFDDQEQWYPLKHPKGEVGKRFTFTGESLTCSLNVIKGEAANLPKPPLHKHYHEQFLIILEGEGEAIVEDKRYPASAGSFFIVPHNVLHNFDLAKGKGDVLNLDVFCPSRREYMKEEFLKNSKP
jgi:quercetin dioxygenase-like cupin family protein